MSLRPCKDCGQQISSDAKVCPHCGKKRASQLGWVGLLAIIAAVFWLAHNGNETKIGSQTDSLGRAVPAGVRDDADLLISRCGKPDIDYSSANEHPRPPIPTRWLTYKKQRVKAVFAPLDQQVGALPPYHWKLFGLADPKTGRPIELDDAVRSMPCWKGGPR